PIHVDAMPTNTASQLDGETMAPTKHPAPTVKKYNSQYFMSNPTSRGVKVQPFRSTPVNDNSLAVRNRNL
ncbi:MAG: hypothetical protein IJU65_07810, partial [Desulfovibrio sp.]|nr:hypothetical protein [Desulfovibrio sp.]